MGVVFAERPVLFGELHLALTALSVALNIAVYLLVKGKHEDVLLKVLWALGLVMMISEVFKQWFCYKYLFDGQVNLWYFPWQLCSVAMYLSFIARYLKGRAQDAVLVYLSTFSLLGALMALAYPENMLFQHAVLTFHSFIYHSLIISEAIVAIEILKKRDRVPFRRALPLFGITVIIAEVINVLARVIIRDPSREPDMFYISPFYPTTQPVFSQIAGRFGTVPEIIIYLLCLVLAAYLLYLLEEKLILENSSQKNNKR